LAELGSAEVLYFGSFAQTIKMLDELKFRKSSTSFALAKPVAHQVANSATLTDSANFFIEVAHEIKDAYSFASATPAEH
jgi:nitrate reductase alpha subunit